MSGQNGVYGDWGTSGRVSGVAVKAGPERGLRYQRSLVGDSAYAQSGTRDQEGFVEAVQPSDQLQIAAEGNRVPLFNFG
ncbi:hypothetical protein [Alicyclobacillus dauci]|uniref:Uncharacterized protein n=1 Tax=Alicyclobacillus dauci TaxID=1475485 RepID=A0ABY6Z5R2_9BACL|nr:hypothetical protein [Alicyclobacillus dauci]WAH37656.1 hypothetical protein NZD86_03835 [Alicyclobacillus dauci]